MFAQDNEYANLCQLMTHVIAGQQCHSQKVSQPTKGRRRAHESCRFGANAGHCGPGARDSSSRQVSAHVFSELAAPSPQNVKIQTIDGQMVSSTAGICTISTYKLPLLELRQQKPQALSARECQLPQQSL